MLDENKGLLHNAPRGPARTPALLLDGRWAPAPNGAGYPESLGNRRAWATSQILRCPNEFMEVGQAKAVKKPSPILRTTAVFLVPIPAAASPSSTALLWPFSPHTR